MSSIDSKIIKHLKGLPVIFKDICIIQSPSLNDIAVEGLDKFYQYISVTQIHKPNKIEDDEVKQLLSPLSDFEYLLLLTQMDSEDNKLIKDALEFFTKEKVTFITNPPSIVFGSPTEKRIMKKDDFISFQDEISLACAMKDPKEQSIEFLDSDTPRVRALKEQMLAGRRKREEAKRRQRKKDGEGELELSDLIGSLTIADNSYNLLNVWDLSYYAFQDQFRRMGWREEFDINTRASLAGAKLDKNKLSHWIKTMSFS